MACRYNIVTVVEAISSYLHINKQLCSSNTLVLPLGLSCLAAIVDLSVDIYVQLDSSVHLTIDTTHTVSVSLGHLKRRLGEFLHGLVDLASSGSPKLSYADSLTVFYGALILVLI